jgi:hypothetical protein
MPVNALPRVDDLPPPNPQPTSKAPSIDLTNDQSSPKVSNAARLHKASRAAGAKGFQIKNSAAKHLLRPGAITDANRMAVATELGVKSGPNFHKRVIDAIRAMAGARGASAIVAPVVGGALAYDAVTEAAEAGGATPAEAEASGTAAAVGTGAATGGAMYGMKKAGEQLAKSPFARTLLNTLGRFSGPMMLNDMAQDVHRRIYGDGPQFLNVPERNPRRAAQSKKRLQNITPSINRRINRMRQTGASPEQIAKVLNETIAND